MLLLRLGAGSVRVMPRRRLLPALLPGRNRLLLAGVLCRFPFLLRRPFFIAALLRRRDFPGSGFLKDEISAAKVAIFV